DHRPQFMFLVKTNPVINRVEFVCAIFKENVTALAVGVVAQHIEKGDRLEALFIFVAEVEVMIFGIIFDVLLERAGTVRTVFAQSGERHDAQPERLTHQIRGDLALGQCVFGEIPQRLLAARGFIHSRISVAFIVNVNEEGVVRAEHELAFEFEFAVLKSNAKRSVHNSPEMDKDKRRFKKLTAKHAKGAKNLKQFLGGLRDSKRIPVHLCLSLVNAYARSSSGRNGPRVPSADRTAGRWGGRAERPPRPSAPSCGSAYASPKNESRRRIQGPGPRSTVRA